MKKISPARNIVKAVEPDAVAPYEYESVYADGYSGNITENSEKQLLQNIFSTIRNHWFLMLFVTFACTAMVIFYVAQKPDYYEATARVQVNAENNPAAGSNSVVVSSIGNDPGYFTTQLQIIEGPGLLRRVAKTLDLENNPGFLNPQGEKRLTYWQNVQRMFGFYKPPTSEKNSVVAIRETEQGLNLNKDKVVDPDIETEKYAPVVSRIQRNLTVSPVKDFRTSSRETRLISIDFTHGDPQIAAKVVNAIADAYVLQNLEQKIQTNASAGDFLQKRVAELQSYIRRDEERLINYSKNNQIVSLDPGQNTVVQRFSDLSMKLGEAENDRINAQSAYQAAMQNQMRDATAENSDSQVVALESRLNELRRNLAQLKTEYTDEWYEVVQVRKQIESLEGQLATLRKRASAIQTGTLEQRLKETIAREQELRANFNKQRDEVVRQNEAAINYRIIQQEIATNKSLLDGLLQRSRENDVILNGTPNNVLVAERAPIPKNAAGPDRFTSVLIAFFVSFLGSCGLAFLLDWMNDSVHNSDQIENTLGLPLLAAIPAAPQKLSKRVLPSKIPLIGRQKRGDYNLSAFDKPEFTESYQQLRTYLLLSSAGGAPRSVLVTSGEEGEGKTLTALNLAVSLTKDGSEVLLIDADLRCPRLHSIKELSNSQGLTTLLTVSAPSDELITQTIQKDESTGLNILTAGGRTVNPAGLISSEDMQKLLGRLSERFKYIVIDSPPVLYFADSTILSTMVDGVIIVVRDGVSSRQLVLKAKKLLHSVGANIVGMVINGIPINWASYGKYRKYGMPAELQAENGYQLLKLN